MNAGQSVTRKSLNSSHKHPITTAVQAALRTGATAALLSMPVVALSQSNFSAVLELSDLDGSDGFVLNGIDVQDNSGDSLSRAGDINGDGVGDLIINSARADPNGIFTGESYVVFGGGSVGVAGVIELSALDGSDGFVLNGIDAFDFSGTAVSGAGDINGDGVGDLVIGARGAGPNGVDSGESYVVFGGGGIGVGGVVELSALDGSDGFFLNGIEVDDRSGRSVSGAGDINGDGVDDLVIGAYRADLNGNGSVGESYLVFGGVGVGVGGVIELSALDGSDGFVLNGIDGGDYSGRSVSAAGDVNGDGVDDLIIGARSADPNGSNSGESYVVFGGNGVGIGGVIELSALDGSDGFVLNGIEVDDQSGVSVSGAGDINGDELDDLIIGAYGADGSGLGQAGESYVVFGGGGVGGVIELSALDGTNGFVLNGIDPGDRSGRSVSGAGDINGDGVGDIIIGADSADPNGSHSGESYVVFGGGSVGDAGVIELSALDGSDGFVLNGIDASDFSGRSVSGAGDVNGDGVDDLFIDASRADPNNRDSGESYVVFGKNVPQCNGLFVTVDLNFSQSPGPGNDVILGTPGNDDIRGRAGNDTICGEDGDDFIHGNSGDDWIDGGAGVDNLRGGQGDDVMYTGPGATVGTGSIAFGGNGDDHINGGADADDIRGGRGLDTIRGNGGDDKLSGNSDADILHGGAGNDELRGGQADDVLMGEAGNDFLSGGGGTADSCDGGSDTDSAASSCELVSNVP